MENVKNKYIFNKNYPDFIKYISSKEFTVTLYVIDDVITSGSTLNEINTLFKNTLPSSDMYHMNEFHGIALGKTQSYPYTDRRSLVEYNYLPLVKNIDISSGVIYDRDTDISWNDQSYVVGP